jgi:toxin FitB
MIILDTNVISEPMGPVANPAVQQWLNQQPKQRFFTTSVNIAELLYGIELLPHGKRKDTMRSELTQQLIPALFGNRILNFDHAAAVRYAQIVSSAKRNGKSIHMPDGQIAAIALEAGFSVATRDVSPFLAAGVKVLNPWEST